MTRPTLTQQQSSGLSGLLYLGLLVAAALIGLGLAYLASA